MAHKSKGYVYTDDAVPSLIRNGALTFYNRLEHHSEQAATLVMHGGKAHEPVYTASEVSRDYVSRSDVQHILEALKWRSPAEHPEDELMRCEVLSFDQVFIAWPCWEDDGAMYWILDAPTESKVGDVRIPAVRAWRPASIETKALNPIITPDPA